ncbi:MAG: M81 family metallopeptidase [Alphaproteobacteria bacterium]|nr:M81 family metallopeptidase [Alphaproteobacteria bacterium]
MPAIAVARFAHEGNSFSPIPTPLEHFRAAEWATGDAVPALYRGTNTEIGGAIAWLERHPTWQPTFLRCAGAPSSGVLAPGVFDAILGEILAALRGRRWDAVFLSLHGSLNAAEFPHADLELLRRVRDAIGADTPLGASFDLHANVTQAEADLLDVGIGYKCHPHTDMAATAEKTLDILARYVCRTIRPVAAIAPVGAILPSLFARTTDGPMAEVKDLAAAIEAREGLLDLTPYPGYAYGDSEAAGAKVWATADGDRARAARAAAELAAAIDARRDRLFKPIPDAAGGIAAALAAPAGPVAVIDSADHTGAGGIGDTPGLLAALVAARPTRPCAFAFLCDPDLVARARALGVGGRLRARLGGRLTGLFGPPVEVEATVGHLSDGRFTNVGPVYHGLAVDLGGCARLDLVDLPISVMITGVCQDTTDPNFYVEAGIDLARLAVLAVKAKNQFRASFGATFRTMIDIDSPGPAAYDFSSFPFRFAPKGLYPLAR